MSTLLTLLAIGNNDGSVYLIHLSQAMPVAGLLLVAAVLVPWERVSEPRRAVLPLAGIAVLIPLQLGVVAHWDPDYALILLVPILWLALRHVRVVMILGLGLATVVFFAPVLARWAWPEAAATEHIVIAFLFTGITVLIATVLHILGQRDRDHAGRVALASVDSLTGLANRHVWDKAVRAAVARAGLHQSALSVVVIDLDGFNTYNEDWGHAAGDRLLVEASSQWRVILGQPELFARIGGDEFGVLLSCLGDEAATIVRSIATSMPGGPPFSAGVVAWSDGETAEALLGRADAALYEAKHSDHHGLRGSVVVGSATPDVVSWTDLLPRVLRDASIESLYQPICRLDDGILVGYEALARPLGWGRTSSVEGLFATARHVGLSRELDELCRQRAVEGAGTLPPELLLFVNIGVGALLDAVAAVDGLRRSLERCGRDPSSVVLEISEAIADLGRFEMALAAYRRAGFRFALDDIGDGHSTLEALSLANPEFLKISRTLTVAARQPGPRATIRALVAFAATNGAHVIAEGIEDEKTADLMRQLGVGLGQGFGLGVPARLPGVASAEAAVAVTSPTRATPLRLPVGASRST
jgi:diguanylate cyclase (GGDEF)-like protein